MTSTAGKVIRCKAAVAWEPNKPLVIEQIEVAPPQSNEVRIKIVATALCRTDLYFLLESTNKYTYPIVFGHEAAGIVESVGPGVTEFKPGDKVIPMFLSQCRECRFCKSPKTNLCEKSVPLVHVEGMPEPVSRLSCRGKKLLQFAGTSTFSEYTVVNQIAVAKIDPKAPLDKRSALESCVKGWGVSVIVGYTDKHDFAARPIQLISGKTWMGSKFGGFKSKDGVPEMVKVYMDKKLNLEEFITHKMTLGQVNDAIELMEQGIGIRTVLSVSPQR